MLRPMVARSPRDRRMESRHLGGAQTRTPLELPRAQFPKTAFPRRSRRRTRQASGSSRWWWRCRSGFPTRDFLGGYEAGLTSMRSQQVATLPRWPRQARRALPQRARRPLSQCGGQDVRCPSAARRGRLAPPAPPRWRLSMRSQQVATLPWWPRQARSIPREAARASPRAPMFREIRTKRLKCDILPAVENMFTFRRSKT